MRNSSALYRQTAANVSLKSYPDPFPRDIISRTLSSACKQISMLNPISDTIFCQGGVLSPSQTDKRCLRKATSGHARRWRSPLPPPNRPGSSVSVRARPCSSVFQRLNPPARFQPTALRRRGSDPTPSQGIELRRGFSFRLYSIPNTIEELLALVPAFGYSQINAAAADCRGGVSLVAELILRDDSEVPGGGFEHKSLAPDVRSVNPLAHHDRRGEEIAFQPFFPHFLAGVRLPAKRQPGIQHAKDMATLHNWRRDIKASVVLPRDLP